MLARAEGRAGAGRPTASPSDVSARATNRAPRDPDESDDDRAGRAGEGRAEPRVFAQWITESGRIGAGRPATTARFRCRRSSSGALDFLERTTARQRARSSEPPPRCRNTWASCARSARSRAGCPRRCGSSANVCSRCTSRPSVRVPDHLYVCSLSQVRLRRTSALFVVGLEEGRVFSSSTEDARAARCRTAPRSRPTYACRPIASTKPCMRC